MTTPNMITDREDSHEKHRDLRIDRGSNPVLREENRKQDWTDGQRKVRQCVCGGWGGGSGRPPDRKLRPLKALGLNQDLLRRVEEGQKGRVSRPRQVCQPLQLGMTDNKYSIFYHVPGIFLTQGLVL